MNDTRHIKGLSKLGSALQQIPAKYEKNILRGALRAGAKPVEAEVKLNIWEDTGEMKSGVKISTSSKGGKVIAKVRVTGKHAHIAPWLEFGVAAHRIVAKKGGWLFTGNGFAKSVNHPGIPSRPVFRPALYGQATIAVLAAAEYSKKRLAMKHGIDTSDIEFTTEDA